MTLDGLPVGRMVGTVMGEPFVRRVVQLLDRFDRGDEVARVDRFGIEEDDRAAHDGIDLRPIDAREPIERDLHVGHEPGPLRPLRAANLDVRAVAVGRDRGAPLSAPVGIPEPSERGLRPGNRVQVGGRREAYRRHCAVNAPPVTRFVTNQVVVKGFRCRKLDHTICSPCPSSITRSGRTEENVVEEFLALLAVQLLVLVAERIVKFVSENLMPVAP